MNKKTLTEIKLRRKHKTFGFLNGYTCPKGEEHFITKENGKVNEEKTELLKELDKLNKKLKKVINKLLKADN